MTVAKSYSDTVHNFRRRIPSMLLPSMLLPIADPKVLFRRHCFLGFCLMSKLERLEVLQGIALGEQRYKVCD